MAGVDAQDVARVFREESGRCVATLVRVLGDINAAEDAVQEAFAVAVDRWCTEGLPRNPGAWITTTARNRAVDRHRRSRRGATLEAFAAAGEPETAALAVPEDLGPVDDDQLRLVFTCCHPVLSPQARVALTLRLLGGLTTAQVAAAFLTTEQAMAARLVRAKRRIREEGVAYRVPDADELAARLDAVLAVVYLVHTTGADRPLGDPQGDALVAEARRLARLLVRLLPDQDEAAGLLALLLLSAARRTARHAPDGSLVLLADQDRGRWDAALAAEGGRLVAAALGRGHPGPYQLQAAIQAVHTAAPTADATDWAAILGLYDRLLALQPSPVVALNRAVAVAEVEGPAAGLALVDGLDLGGYAPLHAVRGELLARLDRPDEARAALLRGAELASDEAVAAHLRERAAQLG